MVTFRMCEGEALSECGLLVITSRWSEMFYFKETAKVRVNDLFMAGDIDEHEAALLDVQIEQSKMTSREMQYQAAHASDPLRSPA